MADRKAYGCLIRGWVKIIARLGDNLNEKIVIW